MACGGGGNPAAKLWTIGKYCKPQSRYGTKLQKLPLLLVALNFKTQLKIV